MFATFEQLGLLRTLIGETPCGVEDMLDAMAYEHQNSTVVGVSKLSSGFCLSFIFSAAGCECQL